MIEINFLPWRENRRKREARALCLYFIIDILTIGFFVMLIHWYFHEKILTQKSKNQQLEIQVFKLKKNARNANDFLLNYQQLSQQFLSILEICFYRGQQKAFLKQVLQYLKSDVQIEKIEFHNQHGTLWGKTMDQQSIKRWLTKLKINSSMNFGEVATISILHKEITFSIPFSWKTSV